MDSKKDCIAAVNAFYAGKKARNEAKRQARLDEVYALIPEVAAIDSELKKNMSACIDFIMSKGKSEEKLAAYRRRETELKERRKTLLAAAKLPENYTDLQYDCPVCKDTGSVGTENCECYKKALSLEYLSRSEIAPEMQKLSFKDFKLDYYSPDKLLPNGKSEYETAKTVLEYSKKYVSAFKKKNANLLFCGVPGCGKTHLSCIIGNELIRRGNFVLYTSLQDMLDSFEAEKFGKGKADTDIYLECDLLILDDLGAEFQSTFSAACLYHVINSRINKKKPFIISTNFSLSEIEEIYDARLSSRIVYETLNIPFPKVDIRLEKKRK